MFSAKVGVKNQNYRCFSCGQQTKPELANKFRFCHYYGKFACTTCHLGHQRHVLPANIVHKWDFREYPVSNFAFKILRRLSGDPKLFNMDSLNPGMVKKNAKLRSFMAMRKSGFKIWQYLIECRLFLDDKSRAKDECSMVMESRENTISLNDLTNIKLGVGHKLLQTSIDKAVEHIMSCQVKTILIKKTRQ